jgi:hypothetical protein
LLQEARKVESTRFTTYANIGGIVSSTLPEGTHRR